MGNRAAPSSPRASNTPLTITTGARTPPGGFNAATIVHFHAWNPCVVFIHYFSCCFWTGAVCHSHAGATRERIGRPAERFRRPRRSTKLAAAAVTSSALAPSSVTSSALASGAVTNGAIANNAVDTAQTANASVTAAKLAAAPVTAASLATGSVTSFALAAGSVTAAAIAANSVTLPHCSPGRAAEDSRSFRKRCRIVYIEFDLLRWR